MSAKNVVEFCLVSSSTRRRFFPQVLWGDKRRAVVRIGQRAVCGGGTGHAKINVVYRTRVLSLVKDSVLAVSNLETAEN